MLWLLEFFYFRKEVIKIYNELEALKYKLEQLKEQEQITFENFITKIAKEKEILNFQDAWLTLENYSLKILVIISILADNNFAFRGKLNVLCQWLGVKDNTYNRKKIIQTIEKLQKQKMLSYIEDSKVYTITITEKARNTKLVQQRWRRKKYWQK